MQHLCTLCTLGDPPGCDACRAAEPEGAPAPSIVYRIVHLPSGEWYVGKHKLAEGWPDPFDDDGYPFNCAEGRTRLASKLAKYPREEFRKDVLAVLPTEEVALWLEGGLIGAEQVANPRCMNLCEGGLGGLNHLNEEVEERRVEAVREASRHPERRAKISAATRERFADPAYRARLAAANRAAASSPEVRARRSEILKAMLADLSPGERRARIAKAREASLSPEVERQRVAACRTPEARARNSAAQRDRYASETPEQRAARLESITSANRASARRPERRAKIASYQRSYWAAMTPEERSVEMKRRAAVARENRNKE